MELLRSLIALSRMFDGGDAQLRWKVESLHGEVQCLMENSTAEPAEGFAPRDRVQVAVLMGKTWSAPFSS
jgi:hypothetical protein